jgi:hypothetical protein
LKTIKSTAVLITFITLLTSAAPLLCAQPHPPAGAHITAIEVRMVLAGEISLPVEFQVALYENLIQKVEKKGGFHKVYRDGDRNAADASDLLIFHTTVTGRQRTGT